jgi:PAS domain S-box-containing protein
MKKYSITLKLLLFIIFSFMLVTLGVFVLSKVQLTKIIDESQQAIFGEKLGVIRETLQRAEDRLQQTGLVEAYVDDIRASAINSLVNTYYKQPHVHAKPIIVDVNSMVIMHPTLSVGYALDNGNVNLFANRMPGEGQFYAALSGKKVWCTYRAFEPWGWIILYAVPIGEKYADVREFSALLFLTIFTITFVVAIFLSLIIAKLMRPIGTLTSVAEQVSKGNLDQSIDISSNDEIGVLAKSFNRMRNAVQEQITRLREEVIERKNIEGDLRDLERYLSDIINSMPSIIIGIDVKKHITQWNTEAGKITGIPATDAYNRPLDEVYPELTGILPLISKAMEDCDTKRLTKRKRQTEDGFVYEDLTIYPLANPKEGGQGAVIRIDNVTKEYELEMRIHQSSKMESVGQLAGGVAHDFNNMLSVVIGNTELAILMVDTNDPLHHQLTSIHKASLRSADLVRQLLAFARKQTIKPEILDINETINGMFDMLQRLIGEDIELVWIPGQSVGKVSIDPSQMDQVLTNLLVNARDAIDGVGKITIKTENTTITEEYCYENPEFLPGRFVTLIVSDNGAGIDKETLPNIFDPFFTTKGLGKGTGLGLSTVYGIIMQHEGFINVYSERCQDSACSQKGQGTTFRIYLPAIDSVESLSPQTSDTAIAPKGTETILIVEDDTSILDLGESILKELEYNVLTASTPEEAIALTGSYKGQINLLITDVVMPQMNGRQLAQRLSNSNANLKCIFMSGYPADVIAHRGILDKDVNFLHKPFSIIDIAVKVREVLDN